MADLIRTDDRSPAHEPRIVLCLGGHDPTGGAGLTADGEAIRAAGGHGLGIVTCLTNQSTCGVTGVFPQPIGQIQAQWRALIADSPIAAIKLGLLGSAAIARAVEDLLRARPDLPVVLDPVLASGAGDPVADALLRERLGRQLPALSTLITPNLPEAQALSGADSPEACAAVLLDTGCRWVLITGTHADAPDVINRLYGRDGRRETWHWPRLADAYHGSGCTLASAIAVRLAQGTELVEAVAEAQAYTWQTLARARHTGRCQLTPNRLFALDNQAEDRR